MLLYYHSWMFYNHFIATLYHFLGLTYYIVPSVSWCFLLVFYFEENQYQMESKRSETFWWFFLDQKTPVGPRKYLRGAPRGAQPTRACLGWWVGPASGAPWTFSLLYKYPNMPETLGESTKINSSRRKFQNHQIQSRHHQGGVHHPYFCLSDDVWVVHCRPTGL